LKNAYHICILAVIREFLPAPRPLRNDEEWLHCDIGLLSQLPVMSEVVTASAEGFAAHSG